MNCQYVKKLPYHHRQIQTEIVIKPIHLHDKEFMHVDSRDTVHWLYLRQHQNVLTQNFKNYFLGEKNLCCLLICKRHSHLATYTLASPSTSPLGAIQIYSPAQGLLLGFNRYYYRSNTLSSVS